MEKVTLQTLKSGVVIDLFNVEFEKMLANINDENTSPTTSRSITIKIEVKPGKTRRDAECRISVSSRLAPIKPAESTLYLDSDDGILAAYEDNPEQHTLDFTSGNISAIGG